LRASRAANQWRRNGPRSLPARIFIDAVTTATRFDGHVVRAGVNYHFNFAPPAPVAAKY
jgi:hypothetical protein